MMYKKIITGLFLFLLISPLAGEIAGINVELEENRVLAGIPVLSLRSLYDQSFFPPFERYFNDHFAYRRGLIKLKSWVDYYVFKTSPSPRVHLGTDGWLYYYRTTHGYFKIDDCIPAEREQMRRLAEQIRFLERMVESSGRKFLFVVAPDKTTVYPEYFGMERTDTPCHMSRYDLLREYLRGLGVKNFVRVDDLLLQAKGRRQVYYKTDTHWNYYGSLLASEAIISHLAPLSWKEYLPQISEENRAYAGDLSKILALDIREDTGFIRDAVYPSMVTGKNMGRFREGERFRFTVDTSSGAHLLPRAILYRDSFATRLLPFLQGAFDQLDVIWSNNVDTRLTPEPAEDLAAARIVIVEVAEMYLPGFIIDLKAWYKALASTEI